MTIVTATDFQNNFGKYLQSVIEGDEIIIMKNGKEVARLISREQSTSFLCDSLVGILKQDCDYKKIKEEKIKKYENID